MLKAISNSGTSGGGGGSGVSSLNSITGAVVLLAGTNITLTPSGQNITIAASGSGFIVTKVSNGSPYTASIGQNIYTIYNTSGASYTFNLDATPATNDICIAIDAGLTATAHPITVQGNGNNIIAGGVSGTSYEIGSNGGAISLVWDGTQWTQYA